MKREIINKLKSIVGKDRLTTAPEELLCYSYDGTGREYPPEAVVFPANTGEISAIMQLANATPFPVVPRGAGSGMTGGALPVAGGVVIALSLLNRILEIDEANQVAVVEPGVITGDLRKTLEKRGLYYPPDPASLKFCTMGGNVAECAGGPSAVKYGVTRDYVLGLEVVLPDGRVIQTGVRTAKGVVGYDLTRLFIGSEGTLGIITKITVRLIPYPSAKKTFLILCKSIMQAASLVAEILAKHRPCTLEYMDRTAIQIVRDKLPFALAKNTEALLLLEVDGDAPSVAIQAAALQKFLAAERDLLSVMQAEKADEIDALWTARRSVSPAAFTLKPHKISEDVVVPRSRIPELVLFVESLAAESGLTIFTFGHAGDGNIHVNIMLDKNAPQEVGRAETATKALFEEVIKLGGTLSGEHGIGITKAAFLPLELDEASLDIMRGIKKFFDPNNILNPGKIFPKL
jgi:glycolate oxidase